MKKNFLAGTILSMSLVLFTIAAPLTAFADTKTKYTFSDPKAAAETQADEETDAQEEAVTPVTLQDAANGETSEEKEIPEEEKIKEFEDDEWAAIADYLSKKAKENGETGEDFTADAFLNKIDKENSYKLKTEDENTFSVFVSLGEDETPVELVETVTTEGETKVDGKESDPENQEDVNKEDDKKTEETKTREAKETPAEEAAPAEEETPAAEETQEVATEEVPLATQSDAEIEMFRLYNPNSGEHFYTGNSVERDSLIYAGWSWEGVGWYAPASSSIPVYRLYNPNVGDHHYTMNAGERDFLVSQGWNDEGIGWYSDEHETVPLYREYNPNAVTGSHNYTTSKGENDVLVNAGWNYEGTAWYATKAGYSLPFPVTRSDKIAQDQVSPTPYLVVLDKANYNVSVYRGAQGNWSKVLSSPVSIGRSTPSGTFHMGETNPKMRYFNSGTDCYCWWASNITGRAGENYFFHSVLYKYGEEEPRTVIDGRLGQTISHGCVRMPIENAKWIYDNVPDGTTIWIY